MTHFNHDWTNDTPALPVAVGDRYYAQDLNDDFNYLKHLPYEMFEEVNRGKGVIVPVTISQSGTLITISGGIGAIKLDTTIVDDGVAFTLPPATKTEKRFERVAFKTTTLALPATINAQYIIATPSKVSLLNRAKAVLSGSYTSRIAYEATLSLSSNIPTNAICVGVCSSAGYAIINDVIQTNLGATDPIGENNIKIPYLKTFGDINNLFTAIRSKYGYRANKIAVQNFQITDATTCSNGVFVDSNIYISNDSNITAITNCTFENCRLKLNISAGYGIGDNCRFTNCDITTLTTEHRTCIQTHGPVGTYFKKCRIYIELEDTSIFVSTRSNVFFIGCYIEMDTDSGVIAMGAQTGAMGVGPSFYSCEFYNRNNSPASIMTGFLFNCTLKTDDPTNLGIDNNEYVQVEMVTGIGDVTPSNYSDVSGHGFIINNTVVKGGLS